LVFGCDYQRTNLYRKRLVKDIDNFSRPDQIGSNITGYYQYIRAEHIVAFTDVQLRKQIPGLLAGNMPELVHTAAQDPIAIF